MRACFLGTNSSSDSFDAYMLPKQIVSKLQDCLLKTHAHLYWMLKKRAMCFLSKDSLPQEKIICLWLEVLTEGAATRLLVPSHSHILVHLRSMVKLGFRTIILRKNLKQTCCFVHEHIMTKAVLDCQALNGLTLSDPLILVCLPLRNLSVEIVLPKVDLLDSSLDAFQRRFGGG